MTSTIEAFFKEYLLVVVGGGVVFFALLATCVAVIVLGALRVKFKRLQKRAQHHRSRSGVPNLASTIRIEGQSLSDFIIVYTLCSCAKVATTKNMDVLIMLVYNSSK